MRYIVWALMFVAMVVSISAEDWDTFRILCALGILELLWRLKGGGQP